MDLARELHMSPRRVLAEHTSRELSEWQAYWRIVSAEREQAKGRR